MKSFYVGYLKMPRSLKGFYLWVTPLLLAVGLGFGVYVSSSQLPSGSGQWDPAQTASVQGLLTVAPYPVLHTADGGSILLVRAGKASAVEFVAPFDGQHITLRGTPIERGGWRMMEVLRADDVQRWSPSERIAAPQAEPSFTVTMEGEIVDSKCFLGVMKPGAGKVHRACAAMCLTGGMPPMLVVTDPAGDKYGYMLITDSGESASVQLVPDVAVPVAVTGTLEVRGDLTYLRMAPSGVSRI